jgi:hypothetical protein
LGALALAGLFTLMMKVMVHPLLWITLAVELIVEFINEIYVFLTNIGDPNCPKGKPQIHGFFFYLGEFGQWFA